MSDFKVEDRVYLECEVAGKDTSDNTYQIKYKNWCGEEKITYHVANDVLHTTDEGLNDAWELARKITLSTSDGGYSCEELENIFGYRSPASIFKAFTPQEALAKVKEYEERNEIKVGDVVRLKGSCVKGLVTRVTKTNIYRLFRDGSSIKEAFEDIGGFAKTGKHYDSIDEFMRSAD